MQRRTINLICVAFNDFVQATASANVRVKIVGASNAGPAPNEPLGGYLARWAGALAGAGSGTGAVAMTFKPLLPGQFEPPIFLGSGAKCLIK